MKSAKVTATASAKTIAPTQTQFKIGGDPLALRAADDFIVPIVIVLTDAFNGQGKAFVFKDFRFAPRARAFGDQRYQLAVFVVQVILHVY